MLHQEHEQWQGVSYGYRSHKCLAFKAQSVEVATIGVGLELYACSMTEKKRAKRTGTMAQPCLCHSKYQKSWKVDRII